MQIGVLANEARVSTKTIRYYESIGLLPPPERSPNGYRKYGSGAVDRLDFIRDAQASGLTLSEIGTILELREHGDATCEHVVELLEHHVAELDQRITDLKATRKQLVALTERARSLDPAECVAENRCQTIAHRTGDGTDHHH